MTHAEPAPLTTQTRIPPERQNRRSEAIAFVTAAGLIIVLALLPLIWNPTFYYFDDTAGGAYGQWYELGRQLLTGHWPLLNPSAWMAGNYTVEQFGLFNPVVLLISLATQIAPNAAALSTIVKIFFMLVGGLGTYVLARSFGAHSYFALVAAVSAPLAGFTFYLDATAWVTNLQVWAYFPWVFWAIRRFVFHDRSYWPAFLFGYLLITVAYVQGTVMLVLLFMALFVDIALRRNSRFAIRTLAAGIPLALITITVYLPGILTAGVTVRQSQVSNSGFMTLTLNGLGVSAVPFASPDLLGWWGRYAPTPYTYIAWYLPLLALCSPRLVRMTMPRLRQPLLVMALVAIMMLGPSDLGPLRFPVRSLPWFALMVFVVCAVLFTHCLDAKALTTKRLMTATFLVCLIYWLAFAANPVSWRRQLVSLLMLIGILAVYWASARYFRGFRDRHEWRRTTALGLLIVTIVVAPLQSYKYARQSEDSFGRSGFPAQLSVLQRGIPGSSGSALVLGDPTALGHQLWEVSSFGNLWYISQTRGINLYSPSGYAAFNTSLCMAPYYGITCYDAAGTLFTPVPDAGNTLLVDLIGLDTIQFVSDTPAHLDELRARFATPPGWSLSSRGDLSFVWQRDQALSNTGAPAWSTEGLHYSVVSVDATRVVVHVDSVPASGGRIVFSRLAWPGYQAHNGSLAKPVAGYLLTVAVPPSSAGANLSLTFRPPGWLIEIIAFVLSWLMAIALSVCRWRQVGRMKPVHPAITEGIR